MKRRTFLKATVATSSLASKLPSGQQESNVDRVSQGYFDALPATKPDRNNTVVDCATELCTARNVVSAEALDAVIEGGNSADTIVQRLEFGVRILNEYNITNTIDVSMIEAGRRDLGDYTRYLPLVGSFNNLCNAACSVETPNPEPMAVKDFLVATAAFGLEVALWSIGTPYKMAWVGTRFVANRTFLRFARHGCQGCIALLMSELHWAIRGSVYGAVVTENNVEFVWDQIEALRAEAHRIDYDIDFDPSYAEVERWATAEANDVAAMLSRENDESGDGLIPEIELPDIDFDVGLPELPEI